MNKLTCPIALLMLLTAINLFSQETAHKTFKKISIPFNDTLKLDTLSIVPQSFTLTDTMGNVINDNLFDIDYAKAELYFKPDFKKNITTYPFFTVKYQTFSFYFYKVFANKILQTNNIENSNRIFAVSSPKNKYDFDFYSKSDLERSGSISRAISFGNSQDISVNSGLTLQLAGKISDDVSILAAITDNNIPVQPEGNTSQLQEFDKVFIKIMMKKNSLTAGDFEVYNQNSHFLKYNKKAQGGLFSTYADVKNKKGDSASFNVNVAAAVAKGKYAKNKIQVIEGNQGPYKLTGNNNEFYIVVLAGSEKVFLDGTLLKRGKDKDYVIDYNTAEITFTPANLITYEKRIIVEFEYSDRNYARSMIIANSSYQTDKFKLHLDVFSEQDHKNQNLQQELSAEQKHLLSSAGDNIESAYSPNIETVEFNNSEVLYKLIDTVVSGVFYDSVFVFSANSDSAKYRLKFSDLGAGNGNYIRVISTANGRVFKWVPPVNGIPQGNWEPVTAIAAPQTKKMLTLSTEFKINKNTLAGAETAFSSFDKNTFSSLNNRDNNGIAFKTWFNKKNKLFTNEKPWVLNSSLVYEFESKHFTPVERFRDAEFERDWNIFSSHNGLIHLPSLAFELKKNEIGNAGYNLSAMLTDNNNTSIKHFLYSNLRNNKTNFCFNSSLLNGNSTINDFKYFKSNILLSRQIAFFRLGATVKIENNKISKVGSDTLMANSFAFDEYQIFAENKDSVDYRFKIFYKERNDFLSNNNDFTKTTSSYNSGFNFDLMKNPLNIFRITGTLRQLNIRNADLIETQPGQTIIGRVEHNAKMLKKVFSVNTFYETGSGMELKKEFSYIEVVDGQGVYKWTDYNENGIRELSEFDVAVYSDQANFVRIYTPTNDYIKIYSNQFSEVVTINPAIALRNKKGFAATLAKFSANVAYRIEHKMNSDFGINAFNPFAHNVNDSLLIMLISSFRGSLFYNRTGSKFGADISYSDNRNKSLLTTGFESRLIEQWEYNIRVNISKPFTFRLYLLKSDKSSFSEYFSSRDFDILNLTSEPSLSWQPSNIFRLSIKWMYSHKENIIGELNEKSFRNRLGSEARYNIASKGSLFAKIHFINIKYYFPENSSLAYEMLEGLKAGNNIIWNISVQRNISEFLQLSLLYDGRSSPSSKAVHTGSVQLRAYF